MEAAEKLDQWRFDEASRLCQVPRTFSGVFNEYRRLVREDVRPNPVTLLPIAVQEAEKEIRYFMEEAPAMEFLARLPKVLATLFERGMEEASFKLGKTTRPVDEETMDASSVERAMESDDRFHKLCAEMKVEPVHPIRRHLQAVRDRQANAFSPATPVDSGLGDGRRDWREV